jgi:DNA-binding NtrC family response regulator
MAIEKVIVLEDEQVVREHLETYLRRCRYDVASTSTLAGARDYLQRDTFDILFLDLRLPDGDGTELLKEIQARPSKPLVIITTGFGSVESAVECMKSGAFDYLIKPYSTEQISFALKKAEDFSQLLKVSRYLSGSESASTEFELLGSNPAMERVRQLIRKVARTQATVLIQGESGTGKEVIARALYQESSRTEGPFIKVNCAAVPENLIESEFFGHEKGAFTGALNKREGRFELAHGGTILLDEISEISPSVQAKLLRVLQEREFERVGGNRPIKVDVRVIATTNRHLEQSVEKKEFRQDLFFRLNVVPIHVPALRERRDDIPQLARSFMRRKSRQHGVHVKDFTKEALEALQAHPWPGNVRELMNVVERAVILCDDGGMLDVEHLGLGSAPQPPAVPSAAPAPVAEGGNNEFPTLDELERKHILAVLEHCKGNRTHAARLLNVSIRTLRNKLHEYNGTSPQAEEEEAELSAAKA